MATKFPFLLLLALCCIVPSCSSYKILVLVANVGSHFMYMGNLAQLFVTKGHEVTLVAPEGSKIPKDITNLKLNVLKYPCPPDVGPGSSVEQHLQREMAFNPSIWRQLKVLELLSSGHQLPGIHLMQDKAFVAQLQAAQFDYVLVDAVVMSYLMVPYQLGVPYAAVIVDCMGHKRRIPIVPSSSPTTLTPFTDDMSFYQRLINFLLTILFSRTNLSTADFTKDFVIDKPATSITDLFRNASLCLQLRDNMVDFIRPEMPDVIPITTIMGRPAQPLPGDLQKFMDDSHQGVIMMSFGSAVHDLPDEVIEKLFTAFAGLKQNVIFKYKSQLPAVPANVRIMQWMPQNDLLGHANLRLFITHCGMNSLIEAVYHGVPVLGFPFAIDQHSNGAFVRGKGIGETLGLHDFTADQLLTMIQKITGEARYSDAAKKMSAIYRDVQSSGLRDPVYWVEHVIKHGARHLRTHAYDMPDYQYFMLDILAFLLVCVLVVILMLVCTCRCIKKCLCSETGYKNKRE